MDRMHFGARFDNGHYVETPANRRLTSTPKLAWILTRDGAVIRYGFTKSKSSAKFNARKSIYSLATPDAVAVPNNRPMSMHLRIAIQSYIERHSLDSASDIRAHVQQRRDDFLAQCEIEFATPFKLEGPNK